MISELAIATLGVRDLAVTRRFYAAAGHPQHQLRNRRPDRQPGLGRIRLAMAEGPDQEWLEFYERA